LGGYDSLFGDICFLCDEVCEDGGEKVFAASERMKAVVLKNVVLLQKIKAHRIMANETDMYYRFMSDNEPSEEQLAFLMQEVREEVREKKSNLHSMITENIFREYQNVKKMFPNL
jgi:hypothetical protein